MRNSAITLLSGGLDSAVATLLARKRCAIKLAITFDYGQRAARREIAAAKAFCRHYKIRHKVIKLPWLKKLSGSALTDKKRVLPRFKLNRKSAKAVWVPNRNAVFINIAAAHAEALKCTHIIAGFNSEEALNFPDNSAQFVKYSNNLLSKSTLSHPKIFSPTQKMKKIDIAKAAVRLKIFPHFFWSCYEGGARMCGTCESCIRVMRAFKWNTVS